MAKNANGEGSIYQRMRDGKLIRYEGAVTYTGDEFWLVGWVDPGAGGQVWWLWWLADEPFGVRPVCVGEHGGALVTDGLGGAVVDVGGSVQAQPAVVMIVVIPGEEGLAVPAGGLDGVEAAGEVGPVLQGLELGFAERVVVGCVRTAVRLGDAEVSEQERHRLGGHRGAAIGVDGQLIGLDACLAQVWRISTSARPPIRG